MKSAREFKPRIMGFLCNWCSYAGADLCGVSRYQYPPSIRIIRVMCSGRIDLEFVLRAFTRGMDGVFIGGCWLGECHYVTEGNYDALSMMHLGKKLMQEVGLNPARLRLEWISASQGNRFAEVMTSFTNELTGLGPLGAGEGMSAETLALKLEAIRKVLPFVKLVEREKLRVRFENKEQYAEYFNGPEVTRLFKDLIADKLTISQILLLLQERMLSTGEIAAQLGINSSNVAKFLTETSRQRLIRFDQAEKRYALA